jgi:hypothetical protein
VESREHCHGLPTLACFNEPNSLSRIPEWSI